MEVDNRDLIEKYLPKNNKIGIVMGGYLDQNNKLLDRTELNRRIFDLQVLAASLIKELKELTNVLENQN